MADFLEEKRKEIQARLKELKPLVEEYHRLDAAERALAGVGSTPARAAPPRRRAAPRAARAAARPTAAAAGPKGSGTRALQALELVRARPGITIPELAEAMEIKQNYLYRVMPTLAEEGQVVKSGRGWHVREDVTSLRGRREAGRQHEPQRSRDRVALAHQLLDGLVDPLLGELGHVEALDDLLLAAAVRTGNEEMIPSATP